MRWKKVPGLRQFSAAQREWIDFKGKQQHATLVETPTEPVGNIV